MRIVIAAALGLFLGGMAAGEAFAAGAPAKAAHKTATAKKVAAKKNATKEGAAKAGPSCGRLEFRALPNTPGDGERTAGSYKSRFARLELRATVASGAATDYYIVANGTRVADAAHVPEAAQSCATTKKMPKPDAPAASCTGDRFSIVIAHAGAQRIALLYGHDGGSWRFCRAGMF